MRPRRFQSRSDEYQRRAVRRLGQDKATLVFHGKSLWEIQLDLLRKLRPREIFLSARSDPVWRPADVHFVPDQAPSRGPLGGLAATLSR
ncbi:MAG: hypothetical protein DME45_11275, partial [Verrucomicrobia bacterium]